MPSPSYLCAAAAPGLSSACYIIRSGPEHFPQSQGSDHISSGYSILSALKLLKSTHANSHTHNSVSPLSKHRTLWPNVVLITKQKALYKAQSVLRGMWGTGRWNWTSWVIEGGGKTSHLDKRQERKREDRSERGLGQSSEWPRDRRAKRRKKGGECINMPG